MDIELRVVERQARIPVGDVARDSGTCLPAYLTDIFILP